MFVEMATSIQDLTGGRWRKKSVNWKFATNRVRFWHQGGGGGGNTRNHWKKSNPPSLQRSPQINTTKFKQSFKSQRNTLRRKGLILPCIIVRCYNTDGWYYQCSGKHDKISNSLLLVNYPYWRYIKKQNMNIFV